MQDPPTRPQVLLLTQEPGTMELIRPLFPAAGFEVWDASNEPSDLEAVTDARIVPVIVIHIEREDPGWIKRIVQALPGLPAAPVVLLQSVSVSAPLPAEAEAWHTTKFPVGAGDLCAQISVAVRRWLESGSGSEAGPSTACELPAGVIITDAEGCISDMNAACEGTLGLRASSVLGKRLAAITHAGEQEVEAAAGAQRRKGELSQYETALMGPDDAVIPVKIISWGRFAPDVFCGDTLIIRDHRQQAQIQDTIFRDHDFTSQIARRMGQGITVTNSIGCFEFVNDAFAKMLGVAPNDLIGRYTVDISSDEDRAAQMVQRALRRAGHSTTYEARLLHKDGSRVTVSINAVPRWKNGEFAGAISVVTDLTEQRKTAAALEESEARFRTLIESSQDGIVVNAHGRILYANPAAIRMFRLASAQVALGRSVGEFVHPADRESAIARTLAVEATGEPSPRTEFRAVRPDGSAFEAESVGIAITFDGYSAVCSTLRDISDRKFAERALRESEERYRALVEWSPAPVVVHRQGRLLYANPAFVKLVGAQSMEEAMARPLLDYIHVSDRLVVESRMRSIAMEERLFPLMEMRGMSLDGREIHAEAQGTAISYAGAPAVCTVVHDVTARKQAEAARNDLEAELRESQKMQAIGTLAGGIAHDFNNILAIILGNVELALQDAGQDSRVAESLEEIRRAASRATEVVRQILSFSRRQPTQRIPIALALVVEESVRLLRATLPARHKLVVSIDRATPTVLADNTQMAQVIINLCTNAMQAIGDRPGRIEISLDTVQVSAELQEAHPALGAFIRRNGSSAVRLTVRDNGPGMDQATLARIFEPFFTTKPVDQGTGLGLAVVHGIVEAHKGIIVTESAPGQGATFAVYLPVESNLEPSLPAPLQQPIPVAGQPAAMPRRAFHMLYLDDDAALVMLVERLMGRRGFKVSGFTDSAAALALIAGGSDHLDVFVSDYNMPGMSGLDVARQVRAMRPDLPIAVTTGFVDERLQAQARDAGVRELIFKATAIDEYCQAFERLAGKVDAHGG
ncbi:MAG: PAS domain S-box protein [Burkholderiales bacterium]|nr:PAS domain S-box protein [Burkholderiales bacterium]